jgi:plasmid stabilization system protein ParE
LTRRFRIEPEASEELGEAAIWYEAQRETLGEEFLEAIDAALDFIDHFPKAATPVPGLPPELPVRRVPVGRFPFHIVYLERSNVIRILAVAHDRRSPGYWESRMST